MVNRVVRLTRVPIAELSSCTRAREKSSRSRADEDKQLHNWQIDSARLRRRGRKGHQRAPKEDFDVLGCLDAAAEVNEELIVRLSAIEFRLERRIVQVTRSGAISATSDSRAR